jgi:hypothetical protein
VELYSWPSGEVRQKFRGSFPQELSAVALTTHADWIAGGDLTGRITVWRGDGSLKPVLEFRGHTEGIRALKFSNNGRHLASTSEDGSLRLWDCVTGAAVVAAPYDGAVVSFAPDGLRMGVGQAGGKLSVLHVELSPVLHRFRPLRPPETPQMLVIHPDGHSLLCLADGGVVRCSVPDGTPLNFFDVHGARSFLPEPGEHDGLVVGGRLEPQSSLSDRHSALISYRKSPSYVAALEHVFAGRQEIELVGLPNPQTACQNRCQGRTATGGTAWTRRRNRGVTYGESVTSSSMRGNSSSCEATKSSSCRSFPLICCLRSYAAHPTSSRLTRF